MNNHHYWIHWSRGVFRKRIALLREVVMRRLLPTFDFIDQEAESISDELYGRLNAVDDPDGDPAMDAEAAEDAGNSHYIAMNEVKQGLLNLFAVALHHLVEQQQLTVIRQEFVKHGENHAISVSKIPKICEEFNERMDRAGVKIQEFPSYKKLLELRHLANTVKHADGHSAEQLRSNRPDLFVAPNLTGSKQQMVPNPSYWPFEPLSGQDVYVTDKDLEQYFDATDRYWEEFETALKSLVKSEFKPS